MRRKVCLHSLAVCSYRMKAVMEQGFFHQFASSNKVSKKICEISNLLKTFEVLTLSNSNLNFVTSLLQK